MWPEGVLTVVAQQAKSESDVYESGHWPTDGRTVAASVSRWSGSDSSRSTHPGSFDESKSSLVGKPLQGAAHCLAFLVLVKRIARWGNLLVAPLQGRALVRVRLGLTAIGVVVHRPTTGARCAA